LLRHDCDRNAGLIYTRTLRIALDLAAQLDSDAQQEEHGGGREAEGQAPPEAARAVAEVEAEKPGDGQTEQPVADEGDDRDGAAAAGFQAVDIPPCVAVGRDGEVEIGSVSIASAACRPESAAIGTPAPGCAPPPAR